MWHEENAGSRGVTERGGEEDLVRRRLGETKPETCTQIAQANKQAQDAGHAPSKGNQAWEQQQQCDWRREEGMMPRGLAEIWVTPQGRQGEQVTFLLTITYFV